MPRIMGFGSTAVDEISIKTNTSGQIYVDTLNKLTGRDPAKMKLMMMINAVNQSLTDTSDDFSEAFSDADGLRNTVDTGNTTSLFSTNKYVNNIYSYSHSEVYINGSTFTESYTYDSLSNLIISSVNGVLSANGNVPEGYIKFYYSDSTTSNSSTNVGAGTYDFNNPNPTKEIIKMGVWVRNQNASYNSRMSTSFNGTGDPFNSDIIFNYDKGAPAEAYLIAYDSDMNEITDNYTFEIKYNATSETTGELNPGVINSGITWTNAPDTLIVHQKDTGKTEIAYVCLVINE